MVDTFFEFLFILKVMIKDGAISKSAPNDLKYLHIVVVDKTIAHKRNRNRFRQVLNDLQNFEISGFVNFILIYIVFDVIGYNRNQILHSNLL